MVNQKDWCVLHCEGLLYASFPHTVSLVSCPKTWKLELRSTREADAFYRCGERLYANLLHTIHLIHVDVGNEANGMTAAWEYCWIHAGGLQEMLYK